MLLSSCFPETPLLAKPAHQPKRNEDRIQVGTMEHTGCAGGPNCTKQRWYRAEEMAGCQLSASQGKRLQKKCTLWHSGPQLPKLQEIERFVGAPACGARGIRTPLPVQPTSSQYSYFCPSSMFGLQSPGFTASWAGFAVSLWPLKPQGLVLRPWR